MNDNREQSHVPQPTFSYHPADTAPAEAWERPAEPSKIQLYLAQIPNMQS